MAMNTAQDIASIQLGSCIEKKGQIQIFLCFGTTSGIYSFSYHDPKDLNAEIFGYNYIATFAEEREPLQFTGSPDALLWKITTDKAKLQIVNNCRMINSVLVSSFAFVGTYRYF